MIQFDLLQTVEYGGCSAKISAELLEKVLNDIKTNLTLNPAVLVGNDTHDDAAVYKINDEQAIIFTTDFFPPVCSDPFTFGQIAAANALSDVYAMGGKVLMALNLIMFPAQKIPLEVLTEILKGGQDKVSEAEALILGGHTIEDYPPKYGLCVVGIVHPDKIVTNACAKAGDVIILTKPLGTGTIIAGRRLGLVSDENYQKALESMKQLNKEAAKIMNKYEIRCATDITGFGLLGHLLKMIKASNVSFELDIDKVPFLDGALELIEMGCIPGAAFRNKEYCDSSYKACLVKTAKKVCLVKTDAADNDADNYNKSMLLYDPQTSGGMAICVPKEKAADMLEELKIHYPLSAIIGKIYEHNT